MLEAPMAAGSAAMILDAAAYPRPGKGKFTSLAEIMDHMIHNNMETIEGVFMNENLKELESTMGMSEKREEESDQGEHSVL
eukprot:4531867-Amphidinium_carterae.3